MERAIASFRVRAMPAFSWCRWTTNRGSVRAKDSKMDREPSELPSSMTRISLSAGDCRREVGPVEELEGEQERLEHEQGRWGRQQRVHREREDQDRGEVTHVARRGRDEKGRETLRTVEHLAHGVAEDSKIEVERAEAVVAQECVCGEDHSVRRYACDHPSPHSPERSTRNLGRRGEGGVHGAFGG